MFNDWLFGLDLLDCIIYNESKVIWESEDGGFWKCSSVGLIQARKWFELREQE
jgi:hypothetical protein